jgi:hypothetical protein
LSTCSSHSCRIWFEQFKKTVFWRD